MVTVNDVQLMTYKESKKVARFYKKLDHKIMRAAKRGYTEIEVPNYGFDKNDVLILLKPYYEGGFEITERSVRSIYYLDKPENFHFKCFVLHWEKTPDIQFA